MTGKQYGTIGLVGVGYFLLALVVLHFLDADISAVDEYTSDYALGDYGWLMRSGFFAVGLGTIAIGLGLRRTLAAGKRVTISWLLVLIAGVGFIGAGGFNGDPTGATELTTTGGLHLVAALVLFLSLIISAWLLRGVFARDESYQRLARSQLWFAILVTVTFVISSGTQEVWPVGLTQRIFVAFLLVYLLVLAANIRKVENSSRQLAPRESAT